MKFIGIDKSTTESVPLPLIGTGDFDLATRCRPLMTMAFWTESFARPYFVRMEYTTMNTTPGLHTALLYR